MLTLEAAEVREWRCGACAIRPPLLAKYTDLGGVYIKIGGKRSFSLHYVVNLAGGHGSIVTHCPACHHLRELLHDPATVRTYERAFTGICPEIDCDDSRCTPVALIGRTPVTHPAGATRRGDDAH